MIRQSDFVPWGLFSGQQVVLQIRPRYSTKSGPYWEAREQTLSPVFHRDSSQVLKEMVLGGRRFTSERVKESIYNYRLSKGTSLRGGSGTYYQVLDGTNNTFLWQCRAVSDILKMVRFILGTQPWADRNYASVCAYLSGR